MGGGENIHFLFLPDHLAGERVKGVDVLDLIAEELDAQRLLLVHRDDLHRVAPDTEGPTVEVHVVARVLHPHEPSEQVIPIQLLALAQGNHPGHILLGRAQAVDTGDSRNHDHVPSGQQRVGRRMAQPLDLLIDG